MTENHRGHRLGRNTLVVAGAVAVAALALSGAWVLSGVSRPTVTIVAIIPLTGVSSYLVEIGDAMSMVTEELNRWGGINGMRIRLVVEDCGSNPELAMSRFIEADDKYHPLAVVTATREVAASMAEVAEERGVVLISVGGSPEDLTDGKDWVFRYYITPSDEADNALKTLEVFNVSSLGILYMDDKYGVAAMTRLTEGFEALNGTVESHAYLKNCSDFSDHVLDVMDNEAVFAVGLRIHYPAIMAELNSSGYSGKVMCAVGASIPATWGLPYAQGCFVNAPTMYMPGANVDEEFMTEFKSRYGRDLTHQGALGSDVLRLIWGLLSDSDVSRENLRAMLDKGFVYSGILGVVVLGKGAHNIDVPIHRAVINGGALTYL